jgi:hypothetical protein
MLMMRVDLQRRSFAAGHVQRLILTARTPPEYRAHAGCAQARHIQLSSPDWQMH